MKRIKAITAVLLGVLLCFAATAMAGEVSFYDTVNNWLVRAYTVDNGDNTYGDNTYKVYMEILDSEGAVIDKVKILVNDEQPLDNPILICDCGAISDQISLAHKFLDGGTDVFLFDTHEDGLALHNNITLSKPGARCGTAAGDVFAAAPTSALCHDGSTQPVSSGSGVWTWTCAGIGGGDPVNCSALAPVNGVCGSSHNQALTAAPTSNLCGDGTTPPVYGGSTGPWSWSCAGLNGGDPANCSATVRPSGSPDLRLSNFSGILSSYNAGDHKQVTITVTNVGNASTAVANACANGQIAVRIYQGNTGNTKATVYVNDLAAEATQSVTLNFTIDQTCGIHTYCVFVVEADSNQCVTESNEGNNASGRVSLRTR